MTKYFSKHDVSTYFKKSRSNSHEASYKNVFFVSSNTFEWSSIILVDASQLIFTLTKRYSWFFWRTIKTECILVRYQCKWGHFLRSYWPECKTLYVFITFNDQYDRNEEVLEIETFSHIVHLYNVFYSSLISSSNIYIFCILFLENIDVLFFIIDFSYSLQFLLSHG